MDRGPIVRGIPRRFGNFSLRDILPHGVFGRGGAKRRRWTQSRPGRPDETFSNTDHPLPDRHVLDYRTLDSVRLVFGEIYADH